MTGVPLIDKSQNASPISRTSVMWGDMPRVHALVLKVSSRYRNQSSLDW